jgi:hypothetical protein
MVPDYVPTAEELAAANAAATAAIAANVPGWEQSMIPAAAITQLVQEVLVAAGNARVANQGVSDEAGS